MIEDKLTLEMMDKCVESIEQSGCFAPVLEVEGEEYYLMDLTPEQIADIPPEILQKAFERGLIYNDKTT